MSKRMRPWAPRHARPSGSRRTPATTKRSQRCQVALKAQDGELLCPECNGPLSATVVAHHYGCALSHNPNGHGAYLDGTADVDTWDDDSAESDVTALSCKSCTFTANLEQTEVQVIA
jgi:hypothetical protein